MSVKLLPEHHLEILFLKGGCTDSSESTFVKMPHCWKSHVMAQIHLLLLMSTPCKSILMKQSIVHCSLFKYRGSYISTHVLLNLLNELGKRDKM